VATASDETRRDGEAGVEVTEVEETGDEIVAHVVGEIDLASVERFATRSDRTSGADDGSFSTSLR
jgi:hypothetical protein